MAQVTIYLPDKLAAKLRRDAKRAGKSLSSYIASLASAEREQEEWARHIDKFYGICRDEPLKAPEDPPVDFDDFPKFD